VEAATSTRTDYPKAKCRSCELAPLDVHRCHGGDKHSGDHIEGWVGWARPQGPHHAVAAAIDRAESERLISDFSLWRQKQYEEDQN
jgi:hypothetical protein